MVASTIVTVASLPVYSWLFRAYGATGLAVASDAGILIQTLTFAVMLHRRRMVSLAGLDGRELARSLAAAVISCAALLLLRLILLKGVSTPSRLHELLVLVLAAILWAAIAGGVLKLTGSALPGQFLNRLRRRSAIAG
jgi:putative peptidoglycan lipid II flippase